MQSILLSFFLYCNLVSGLSSDGPHVRSVFKVDSSKFEPNTHYYHTHANGNPFETPVLVENVLSKQECEAICNTIVQELGTSFVDLQRKTKMLDEHANVVETETDIMECELQEAFEYIMESQHDDAFFCFGEGMLDDDEKLEHVKGVLRQAKERLFGVVSSDVHDDKRDLFEYFPEGTKPSDCVVVAGEGATSTVS